LGRPLEGDVIKGKRSHRKRSLLPYIRLKGIETFVPGLARGSNVTLARRLHSVIQRSHLQDLGPRG